MQVKVFLILDLEAIDNLFVAAAAEGDGAQGLGFAPGEQRGAMHDRQNVDFAGDVANVIQAAAINAVVFFKNGFTHVAADQLFKCTGTIFILFEAFDPLPEPFRATPLQRRQRRPGVPVCQR